MLNRESGSYSPERAAAEQRESEPVEGRFVVSSAVTASEGHPDRCDDKILGVPDDRVRADLSPGVAADLEVQTKKEQQAMDKLSERQVYAVFDGVSLGNGDVASRVASGIIADHMSGLDQNADAAETEIAMREAFELAHRRCRLHNAGTTADVVRMMPAEEGQATEVVYAHCGDGRIYVRRADGELEQVTTDMNEYNNTLSAMVDGKVMTAEEAAKLRQAKDASEIPDKFDYLVHSFMMQHAITASVGSRLNLVTGRLELQPGEAVLMVSDGVHDNLSNEEIADELSHAGPDPAGRLTKRVAEKLRRDRDWRHRHTEVREEILLASARIENGQGQPGDAERVAELVKKLPDSLPSDLDWIKGADDVAAQVIEYPAGE